MGKACDLSEAESAWGEELGPSASEVEETESDANNTESRAYSPLKS